MHQTQWAEISCTVPEDMAEAVADFLLDLTGNGVSIENRTVDTFNINDLAAEPVKSVKGYLPVDADLETAVARINDFLAEIGPDYPGFIHIPPTVTELHQEDWANSWKANFKPTRIGTRLVMKPSWEEYAPLDGDIVLELDPGMAFGTGTHGTTRLCLEAVEKLVCEDGAFGHGNATVLDVGCGSGVLAIAAALFGAEAVTAIDIDPVAVDVTAENAAVNGVTDRVRASVTPLAELDGEYAIVLANILAEDLVRMGGELAKRVMPSGYLVLSGILTEREQFVIDGFSPLPLALQFVTRQDEWSCLVFRKSS
ncbi:MAG TPA: 50S ribosomal protein L11 methyltransferase [Geobacteraceae bacterium]|nr:50S ribosomal protein L11 methyltransferase [Geobacteraceae bacterium]